MSYTSNREFGDSMMTQIKNIIGPALLKEAPMAEDCERNSDLVVLHMDNVRIGVRMRRHWAIAKYGNEFTIRTQSRHGGKTELDKIEEGWGRFMFYGFENEAGDSIARWYLIDLNRFRAWCSYMRATNYGGLLGKTVRNPDGTQGHAFDVSLADKFGGVIVDRMI